MLYFFVGLKTGSNPADINRIEKYRLKIGFPFRKFLLILLSYTFEGKLHVSRYWLCLFLDLGLGMVLGNFLSFSYFYTEPVYAKDAVASNKLASNIFNMNFKWKSVQ